MDSTQWPPHTQPLEVGILSVASVLLAGQVAGALESMIITLGGDGRLPALVDEPARAGRTMGAGRARWPRAVGRSGTTSAALDLSEPNKEMLFESQVSISLARSRAPRAASEADLALVKRLIKWPRNGNLGPQWDSSRVGSP